MKQKTIKYILQFLGLVLSFIITVVALVPLECTTEEQSQWMGNLSDPTPLNLLTIPGTHDSGALYSYADVSGKCQSVPIGQQLKMGVRFLDIRLQLDHDVLKIVHSFADQKLTLEEVLQEAVAFIRENPTEFLLISCKEDAAPEASDVSFSTRLEEMLSAYPDTIVPDSTLPPTLGEARGKIFILSRYNDASIGIPAFHGWQDNASFPLGTTLYVQDQYAIADLSHKKDAILHSAQEALPAEYNLVLHFTSCYLTHGFPPLSAAVQLPFS